MSAPAMVDTPVPAPTALDTSRGVLGSATDPPQHRPGPDSSHLRIDAVAALALFAGSLLSMALQRVALM